VAIPWSVVRGQPLKQEARDARACHTLQVCSSLAPGLLCAHTDLLPPLTASMNGLQGLVESELKEQCRLASAARHQPHVHLPLCCCQGNKREC
jgi:hypothetical protein